MSAGRGPWGMAARCGPLSLLGGSFLLVLGALGISGVASGAVGGAAVLLALIVLVGPTGFPPIRLLAPGIALTSIVWSNWLLSPSRDWGVGFQAGLRVAFFVVPGVVLASYLDPSTVGDHLGQRLRLPARPVLAFVAAMQRFEDLGAQWEEQVRARRVRGLGAGGGPASQIRYYAGLVFTLLVEAVRGAGRMTVGMEARGYSAPLAGRRARTWMEPAPWTVADTALLVLCAVLAVIPTVAGRFIPA